MIINILWISSLWVAGWCSHILCQDIYADWQESRQVKRQRREDDEVLRIVSGLDGDPNPEVDVEAEEIKPTWRERLADWWSNVWLQSTPRTHEQLAGFVSYSSMDDKLPLRQIFGRYKGRHRGPGTLNSQENEDGLSVPQDALPG